MDNKMKIRKGDTVVLVTGPREDKGKQGEVIRVMPKERRIVVQGHNIRKKHQRQVQTQGRSMNPGIIEFEGSLDISNVMLVCPKCNQPTRVSIRRDDDGLPYRLCRKCKAEID